ncbi:DNA-dependent metalloprotease SPRTN-like [Mixophyes fleayi]|uniref:DNA-dependent metalloprotease SPRTN-like n=1 Tax=Mixophyes fleayi TaxID=3061075 RepID=UPI003F4DC0D8
MSIIEEQVEEEERLRLSVVDPAWETMDPTPNIEELLSEFNNTFFWGKLEGVQVSWSSRMTQSAGLCYHPKDSGGSCRIKLSRPILSQLPRKDLVESLLHEMIHAYLYITNTRDNVSHGPEFLRHMHRINSITGANISVYHTFEKEVEACLTHWWRCDGLCRMVPPYYGYIKKATNRPPCSKNQWWSLHQTHCGGTFIKIKEPQKGSQDLMINIHV